MKKENTLFEDWLDNTNIDDEPDAQVNDEFEEKDSWWSEYEPKKYPWTFTLLFRYIHRAEHDDFENKVVEPINNSIKRVDHLLKNLMSVRSFCGPELSFGNIRFTPDDYSEVQKEITPPTLTSGGGILGTYGIDIKFHTVRNLYRFVCMLYEMTHGDMSNIWIQHKDKPVSYNFSGCIPLHTILRAKDFNKVLDNYKNSIKTSYSDGWVDEWNRFIDLAFYVFGEKREVYEQVCSIFQYDNIEDVYAATMNHVCKERSRKVALGKKLEEALQKTPIDESCLATNYDIWYRVSPVTEVEPGRGKDEYVVNCSDEFIQDMCRQMKDPKKVYTIGKYDIRMNRYGIFFVGYFGVFEDTRNLLPDTFKSRVVDVSIILTGVTYNLCFWTTLSQMFYDQLPQDDIKRITKRINK